MQEQLQILASVCAPQGPGTQSSGDTPSQSRSYWQCLALKRPQLHVPHGRLSSKVPGVTHPRRAHWGAGLGCGGTQLLDHLHAQLEAADAAAAPLLRRLLLASYQPYAEHLEDWLFRPGTCMPPGSAFAAAVPANLTSLLPHTSASRVRASSLVWIVKVQYSSVSCSGLSPILEAAHQSISLHTSLSHVQGSSRLMGICYPAVSLLRQW